MDFDQLRKARAEQGRRDPLSASLPPAGRQAGWDEEAFIDGGAAELTKLLRRLRHLGMEPAPRRALDLGCGAGRLTGALAERFERVVALDLADELLVAARRLSGEPDNVRFALWPDENLAPLDDNSVTFAYAGPLLGELPPAALPPLLADLLRVLAPGGVAIVHLPADRGDGEAATAPPRLEGPALRALVEAGCGELVEEAKRSLGGWRGVAYTVRKSPLYVPFFHQHPSAAVTAVRQRVRDGWEELLRPRRLEPGLPARRSESTAGDGQESDTATDRAAGAGREAAEEGSGAALAEVEEQPIEEAAAAADTGAQQPTETFLAEALWLASPHLQEMFPRDSAEERARFLYWLAANVGTLDLQSWAAPPVDWSWYDRAAPSPPDEDAAPEISNLLHLVWSTRPDLRQSFPLTRSQEYRGLLEWAASGLRREYGDQLARVAAGRKRSRRPSLLRRAGWRRLLPWRGDDRSTAGREGKTRRLPARRGERAPGINLVTHPGASIGIAEAARENALAFAANDVPFTTASVFNAERATDEASAAFRHGATLYHVNADQMALTFGQLGTQAFGGRYNVAQWFWELPACPPEFLPSFAFVDEVWAPSRFVYQAFARQSPVPVVHLPCAVTIDPGPDKSLGRGDFSLPEDDFLFLFTFDASSHMARKNPEACIRAFERAFKRREKGVGLVIKATNVAPGSRSWQRLHELAERDRRVHLVEEAMERSRVLALVDLCDAYLSLHRSEGFGRGPAEAMLLGKPVVVTAYAGPADYCRPETAMTVGFRLVPVLADEYPFHRGQVWAEPDVDQAAAAMRRLAEDQELARRIAGAGKGFVGSTYSPEVVGRRYSERLRCLGLL